MPEDPLASLPPLREVIARHELAARKKLGQHFLLDGNLTDRIARASGDLSSGTTIEVGPGPGGLTRALLEAGAHVIAVEKDHRFLPLLEKMFRKFKRPVGSSWRMDETYIRINGPWEYRYRAVDKSGKTIDFLLTANRDKAAAMRFFEKAMEGNGFPEKVAMDKRGANKSAIDPIIDDKHIAIQVRQIKYLNNVVEQDHRAIKRQPRPMLGFKSFHVAKSVRAGIELMHMIKKGQMKTAGANTMSFAEQFYALAGEIRPV